MGSLFGKSKKKDPPAQVTKSKAQ